MNFLSALPRFTVGVLTTWIIGSTPAHADAYDTLNVTVDQGFRRESNLFRTPTPRPETLSSTALGLSLDKSYSLQRFKLDASYNKQDFHTYDYLSYGALNYDAKWLWSFTPSFHGTLSSDRLRELNSFTDVSNPFARNLRTTRNNIADAEWAITPALRLLGRVSDGRRTNDLPVAQEGDSTQQSTSLGLRYVTKAGSSLSYRVREGKGEYFNRVQTPTLLYPTRFDDREHIVALFWPVTSKVDFSAQISHQERRHANLAQRDYSDTGGTLGLKWRVSAKVDLALTLSRDVTPYQTNFSNFTTLTRFIIAPAWRISEKTSLKLRIQQFNQTYGGVPPGTPSALNRDDDNRDIALVLDWNPYRPVYLSLTLQNQRRSSTVPGLEFKNNIAGVAARVNF